MSLPSTGLPEDGRRNLLLTHSVLAGLTPLVPVPWVDDQLYTYLLRSLMQRLGDSHARPLTSNEIEVLSAQRGQGCALGCLGSVLLYPLKKVLSKLFFFLEWKRAVDTISHTYHQGYLLDIALAEGWLDMYGAVKVRTAIDSVLARTNTSLFTRAISGVLNQSKGLLQGVIGSLTRYLSGTRAQHKPDEVAQAVAGVQEEEKIRLGSLTSQLQRAISSLPTEHFQHMRQELATELSGRSVNE